MIVAAWICLLLPLAGALVITLAGNLLPKRVAGILATSSVAGAFAAAVVAFVVMLGDAPEQRSHVSTAFTWLSAGSFHAGFSILLDPLSLVMMMVVTGVGSLIVLYSIGYMHGDNEERRYFGYMALFVFSMLLLVQGGNLLLMLVGWGLVGLSSYLLIGFWHERPAAVAAAKKAFVVNAIGDATFAVAIILIIQQTGRLGFDAFGALPTGNHAVLNLIALGLLGGAVAKSAQLPLHTWLPDAMEGPTPVSALIHAATMVTAGVYLIARTHTVFELAPHVQDVAAGIGAFTIIVAGLIALVQTDIKRVIAYSTMSQIGYMFVGVGVGAYASGMFHLMTHAFFKALLFMGAGIVIHALGGEQDIRKMGGLRRLMPKTYLMMLIGSLALIGFPLTSGFFSKDAILAGALARGNYGAALWILGMIGALLTGLYTTRMFITVFHGDATATVTQHLAGAHSHGHDDAEGHEHGHDDGGGHAGAHHGEGPRTMLVPVAILAVLALVGGFIQVFGWWTGMETWLESVTPALHRPSGVQEAVSSIAGPLMGLLGVYLAWSTYGARKDAAPRPWAVLEHKFYFDELYDRIAFGPAALLSRMLTRVIEGPLVIGSGDALGQGTRALGERLRPLQNGLVRSYALLIAGSFAVMAIVFLAVR
jgi:NADH-quinone oxidoreductase subunit L